ncbi:MAG: signal peptidase II [Firmicutes bacterium]|nr:signal peptidase II [Bacillota bacterium]
MKKFRYLIIAALLAADHLLKYYIRATMYSGQSIAVIDNIFSITYVQNRGAAFSMFEGMETLLTWMPAIALIIAVWYMEKHMEQHWTLILSMILIIAGGLGNLIDRVTLGFVTDMFDFHFWPVFNIADIAICVGCGFLILFMFVFDKPEDEEKSDTPAEA